MDSSPLARLPAELRNQIFSHVALSNQRIKCALDKEHLRLMKCTQLTELLPLTATCRQLRREVLPMVYGGNKFRILTWGTELQQATIIIENWLVYDLGAEITGKLRKVELELEYSPTELLHNVQAIASIFSHKDLRLEIHLNAIWTESGYERCMLPVQIVLQAGELDVEGYTWSVETAMEFQKEVLKQSYEPFWSVQQDLIDLKEAGEELLSLAEKLGAGRKDE